MTKTVKNSDRSNSRGLEGAGSDRAGQVQWIEVGRLVLSPDEARKTVDQAALKELAASIELHGVEEPLIVRVTGGGAGPFEIVAGQRRWLASKLAGKATCPCIVRAMSDAEAARARITSNLLRENLPPMEEAEGFGKLLAEPGATIETVAATLGKSAAFVGRRLKLLDAIEPVREALKAGAIEVGHALLLAPLDEAQQRKLLSRMQCGVTLVEPDDIEDESGDEGVCRFCGCTASDACDPPCAWANEERTVCDAPVCLEKFRAETGQGKAQWRKTYYSVVELRREIENTTYVDLKDAPFPLIADLAPMACTDCPKRAGNAQLLFDDCAQDTCTDRPCFNHKVNAWIEAELAAAKSDKRKLLKLSEGYHSEKDIVRVDRWGDCARLVEKPGECEHGEDGIYVDGQKAGLRAIVCRKADCKKHRGGAHSGGGRSSAGTEASPKEQEKRKALLAQVKANKEYRVRLFRAIAAVKVSVATPAMLVALVKYAIGRSDGTLKAKAGGLLGWDEKLFSRYGAAAEKKIDDHLAALGAGDAVRAALLFSESSELTVHAYASGAKPEGLEMLARMFGVRSGRRSGRLYRWQACAQHERSDSERACSSKVGPK